MKSANHYASGRFRAAVARTLGSVLLISIICSVFFGFAHRHGNEPSRLDKTITASVSVQAYFSSSVPRDLQSDGHECLICLQQRQLLFICIVHSSIFDVTPSEQPIFAADPTDSYHSKQSVTRSITRQSGRAPPLV